VQDKYEVISKIDLTNYERISLSHRTPRVSSELVHRDNEKARDRSAANQRWRQSARESYICERNFTGKTPSHRFAEVAVRFDVRLSKWHRQDLPCGVHSRVTRMHLRFSTDASSKLKRVNCRNFKRFSSDI